MAFDTKTCWEELKLLSETWDILAKEYLYAAVHTATHLSKWRQAKILWNFKGKNDTCFWVVEILFEAMTSDSDL